MNITEMDVHIIFMYCFVAINIRILSCIDLILYYKAYTLDIWEGEWIESSG